MTCRSLSVNFPLVFSIRVASELNVGIGYILLIGLLSLPKCFIILLAASYITCKQVMMDVVRAGMPQHYA